MKKASPTRKIEVSNESSFPEVDFKKLGNTNITWQEDI